MKNSIQLYLNVTDNELIPLFEVPGEMLVNRLKELVAKEVLTTRDGNNSFQTCLPVSHQILLVNGEEIRNPAVSLNRCNLTPKDTLVIKQRNSASPNVNNNSNTDAVPPSNYSFNPHYQR